VTQQAGSQRPRHIDVVASYDRGVDAYEVLWSPVILPPAIALVRRLELGSANLVVDVGAGTGALLAAIRSAAPTARTVALDASEQMLRVARRRGTSAVLGDALALPLAAACADAVVMAYVLPHLADPVLALTEAARVLRHQGQIGTVTWAWEQVPRAGDLWQLILTEAGVPAGPVRGDDTGLDNPGAVEATLRSAGLRPTQIWPQPVRRQWDRSSYLKLASGSGASQIRLSKVDAATRAAAFTSLQDALERLGPDALLFEGEVLCAIATK